MAIKESDHLIISKKFLKFAKDSNANFDRKMGWVSF